jgi:hypothetical protein
MKMTSLRVSRVANPVDEGDLHRIEVAFFDPLVCPRGCAKFLTLVDPVTPAGFAKALRELADSVEKM